MHGYIYKNLTYNSPIVCASRHHRRPMEGYPKSSRNSLALLYLLFLCTNLHAYLDPHNIEILNILQWFFVNTKHVVGQIMGSREALNWALIIPRESLASRTTDDNDSSREQRGWKKKKLRKYSAKARNKSAPKNASNKCPTIGQRRSLPSFPAQQETLHQEIRLVF